MIKPNPITDTTTIPIGEKSIPKKIDIKSNREDGEIGVHKTIFKSKDDEIIVFHNAFNRTIFATGALETSQWIAKQEPGLYTYKDFMDSVK